RAKKVNGPGAEGAGEVDIAALVGVDAETSIVGQTLDGGAALGDEIGVEFDDLHILRVARRVVREPDQRIIGFSLPEPGGIDPALRVVQFPNTAAEALAVLGGEI